jgi:hypothetical protein
MDRSPIELTKVKSTRIKQSSTKKEFSGKWSVLAAAWGSQFTRESLEVY